MTLPLPHPNLQVSDPDLGKRLVAIQDNLDAIAKQFPIVGFLGLAATGAQKIAFGTDEVEWPGGDEESNPTTVTHGLGTTPTVILAMHDSFNVACFVYGGNKTSTTFDLQAKSPGITPAAAFTAGVSWVAIG